MKKKILLLTVMVLFLASIARAECVDMPTLVNYITQWKTGTLTMADLVTKITLWKSGTGCAPGTTPVAKNGQLHVCGTNLCNQYNQVIQLRGVANHGFQWYGWKLSSSSACGSSCCLSDASMDVYANEWKGDVWRVSMYLHQGGYESSPTESLAQVDKTIDALTARGIYAVVNLMDNPGDPMSMVRLDGVTPCDHVAKATEYFTHVAQKYGSQNNILYEITNEPNGVTWDRILEYANIMVPRIRAIDPDAIIIVGTERWDTFGCNGDTASCTVGVAKVVNNPVNFPNIMYTFHFYAASHTAVWRTALSNASASLPVFTTEWGTSSAEAGDGGNDLVSAQAWVDLMKQRNISWAYWNYCDDFRSASVWIDGTCPNGPWTTSQLKESGIFVRDKLINR